MRIPTRDEGISLEAKRMKTALLYEELKNLRIFHVMFAKYLLK